MVISYFLLLYAALAGCAEIPCHLRWVPFEAQSFADIQNQTIQVFGKEDYVARAKSISGSFTIGQYNSHSKKAVFPDNEFEPESAEFDILTNPYQCDIKWSPKSQRNSELDVSADYDDPTALEVVGQAVSLADRIILSGDIRLDGQFIGVSLSSGNFFRTDRYYILQSSSKGFITEVKDFEFLNAPETSTGSVMGIEYITNNADVSVSQVVTHSKTVSQSASFSEFQGTSTTWGVSMEASYNSPGFSASMSAEHKNTEENVSESTFSTSREVTIQISQNISVPAYSSVVACSILQMNEKFSSSYKATAYFRAKSLKANVMARLLQKHGWVLNEYDDEDDVVSSLVDGHFEGDVSIKSNLIVTERDSIRSCKEMI